MPATIAQVIAALSSVLPTLTQMIAVLGTPRLARLNLVASRGYILGASSRARLANRTAGTTPRWTVASGGCGGGRPAQPFRREAASSPGRNVLVPGPDSQRVVDVEALPGQGVHGVIGRNHTLPARPVRRISHPGDDVPFAPGALDPDPHLRMTRRYPPLPPVWPGACRPCIGRTAIHADIVCLFDLRRLPGGLLLAAGSGKGLAKCYWKRDAAYGGIDRKKTIGYNYLL